MGAVSMLKRVTLILTTMIVSNSSPIWWYEMKYFQKCIYNGNVIFIGYETRKIPKN